MCEGGGEKTHVLSCRVLPRLVVLGKVGEAVHNLQTDRAEEVELTLGMVSLGIELKRVYFE